MHRVLKISFVLLIPLITHAQQGQELFKSMIETSRKINTLKTRTVMYERFNGKLHLQKSYVKVQHSPFRLYYRQDHPQKGIEILYVDGRNNNKALVKPNSFPWINMLFDPYDMQLRDKQHHTLFHPGFSYFVSIMEALAEKYNDKLDEIILYEGEITWNGKNCYHLTLSNPDFGYTTYTVGTGEDLDKIADKLHVSSYMLLEINEKVKDYKDVKTGESIRVPVGYAKKMTVYIEKQRNIPVFMEIFDDKGVFEKYEFYNLELNISFEKDEFSPEFRDYHFK
ncbi:MAG: DUF1571 domain-containing protein [Bacteroidota bacterium]